MRSHNHIENYVKKLRYTVSAEAQQSILKQVSEALETKTKSQSAAVRPSFWRHTMQSKMTKFTAAAIIIIAAIIAVHSTMFVAPTFADVIKPLFEAKTIAFDMIFGTEEHGLVMHDIVKGQFIRRTMSNMPGLTMIIDINGEKMLNLDSNTKGAMYSDIKGPIKEGTKSFLAFIRDVITRVQQSPDFKSETLPKKEFNGKTLIGFLSKNAHEQITIWADPKTSLPERIELQFGQQPVIMKNFKFNIPVDDDLISMKVPAGYALPEGPALDLSNPTEKDFTDILRIWAKVMLDGQFPDTISTQEFFNVIKPLMEKLKEQGISDEEGKKIGGSYANGMMFLQLYELQKQGPWHYAGKGVRLGDSDKAIFWYKPRDAKNYRVIYGDLSVKEVTEENLPK